ncbi:CD1845 family protein [Megasphaera stantonii]|uniref:CD1845 family protein n=1 Tax=Megasphaera stantonii TaxID=2144175 RepID=UPI001EF419DD|nr:CD1845 family protein [Megasphaera stantonii]
MTITIASVIVAVLGIGLFFTPTPLGGFVFLFLAFLFSPYGLQAVAGSLIEVLDCGKSALCRFLVS